MQKLKDLLLNIINFVTKQNYSERRKPISAKPFFSTKSYDFILHLQRRKIKKNYKTI